MPAWLLTGVRTGIQAGWGCVAAWLLSLGVSAPVEAPVWLVGAAVALMTLAVTALVRWMETRSATSAGGRLAQRVARLFMLGTTYAS